jgi:DNA-binding transcriptional MerR regulator
MCHRLAGTLCAMPSDDVVTDALEAKLTIDDLARVSGVTVRNIRAYQARGLLPPPEVRARTGFYGSGHEARLELIKDLQAEGVKLDTIKRLLDTTGGSTEEVVAFIRRLRKVFAGEDRQISDLGELAERFPGTDETSLKRALKMGLLREVGDGQYEEISPRLMRAAQDLHELGIPLARSLDVVDQLGRHAGGIARVYVDLFLDEVWKPFDSSGRPAEQWPRVYETVERLRHISGEAMVAVLEMAISERLDVTFGRDLARTVRTTSGPATRADS